MPLRRLWSFWPKFPKRECSSCQQIPKRLAFTAIKAEWYLGGCKLNCPLGSHVAFVSHEQCVDTFVGVSVDFSEPSIDVGEGLCVGNVVDDDDSVGASIIAGCDGSEALLAGCVPNLKLHRLAVQVHCSNFKVHPDGANEAVRIGVVLKEPKSRRPVLKARYYCKAKQQARFPDTGIANHEQFEQVIAAKFEKCLRKLGHCTIRDSLDYGANRTSPR